MFSVYLVWHRENQGKSFSFLCLPGRGAVRPHGASRAAFCGVDEFTSAITSCLPCWMALSLLSGPSVQLSVAPHCPSLRQSWGTMHRKTDRAPWDGQVVCLGAHLFDMHWESPKDLVNRLPSRPCWWTRHSGFLMSLRDAGCWPQGRTLKNKDLGNTKTE